MRQVIKEMIQSKETVRQEGAFYHPVCQTTLEMVRKNGKYECKNIEIFSSNFLQTLELQLYAMQGLTQVNRIVMHDMMQQVEMMVRMFGIGMERILNKVFGEPPLSWNFGIDLVFVASYPEANNPIIESFVGIKNDYDLPVQLEGEFTALTDTVTECSQWIMREVIQILMEYERFRKFQPVINPPRKNMLN